MFIEDFLVQEYASLTSTQSYASELIQERRVKHGLVVLAKEQTAARGARGTEWITGKGNVAMTLILDVLQTDVVKPQISYVGAIAVGNTILKGNPAAPLSYKWINDILLSNMKCCGILTECFEERFVLVGIGVNLATAPIGATALTDHGVTSSREEFIVEILSCFKMLYNDWLSYGFKNAIKPLWEQRAYSLNQTISVAIGERVVTGIMLGLNDEGALLVKTQNQVEAISSGRLQLLTL